MGSYIDSGFMWMDLLRRFKKRRDNIDFQYNCCCNQYNYRIFRSPV